MFGQFCCCTNSDEQSTMEVNIREHRFEGSTKSIQIGNRDHVLVLSPDAAAQRSDVAPTVWRTTQVQQPMNIVFTYSNRQQLQKQTHSQPTINIGQAATSNYAQSHPPNMTQALSPKNPMLIHQTNMKRSTDFDLKHQNSPISFQSNLKQQQNVPSWQPETRSPPTYQNDFTSVDRGFQQQNGYVKSRSPEPPQFNNYTYQADPAPWVPPTTQYKPIDFKHHTFDTYKSQFAFFEKPPTSQSPTPIQNLKSQQSTNFPVYQDYKKEAQSSMLANTITEISKPVDQGSKTPKQTTKKKGSKVQGRRRQTSASSRDSNKITSPNSKTKGLSSAKRNFVSQRLLQHRPCGRRHCTACQLKKKHENENLKK